MIATETPLCECHDEPMGWRKRPTRPSTGSWYCLVKARESDRRRYAADPQRAIDAARQWALANPERHRENIRRWQAAHPEKAHEYYVRRYATNPQKVLEINRRSRLKNAFGITPEQYDEMLAAQGGVCAVCARECSTGVRLCVDHDHKSGLVRGLLCRKCNRGIGIFDDDPERCIAAASYLEKAAG